MTASNRRDFLKKGALLGAGTVATTRVTTATRSHAESSETASASSRQPLNLGIVTYNIANDWTLDDVFKNLEEVGIYGVELRSTHAHKVEVDLSPEARAEVKKRFADSPIQLVQM